MAFPWMPFLIALVVAGLALCCMQQHQYLVGVVDGYYRPANTNFEPMSDGDATAQPAAVDPGVLAAAGATTTTAQQDAVASLAHPLGHSQQVMPADLLPKNVQKQWLSDSAVPSLAMPSLAAPDYRTGRDTIGQSLKNPNLQIRPDPPIGRSTDTGIFNQSIIEPDRPDKSQLAIR